MMTREELEAIFAGGAKLNDDKGKQIGMVMPEKNLLEYGFTKQQLRKLEKLGLIEKKLVRPTPKTKKEVVVKTYPMVAAYQLVDLEKV